MREITIKVDTNDPDVGALTIDFGSESPTDLDNKFVERFKPALMMAIQATLGRSQLGVADNEKDAAKIVSDFKTKKAVKGASKNPIQ